MASRASPVRPSHPDVIEFARALARAHVARDIAEARAAQGESDRLQVAGRR